MITLVIHSNLKPYFKDKRELSINCRDYHSLMSFMINSFPEFNILLKKLKTNFNRDFFFLDKNKKRVNLADVQANKKLEKDAVYYLVPSLIGAGGGGGGFMQIALGVAIMAMAFYLAPVALGGAGAFSTMGATAFQIGTMAVTYTNIAMFGASMALQGIMSIVQKPPNRAQPGGTIIDDGSKTENSLFTGLNNTLEVGFPVGMNYGATRIGGQMISGYVKSLSHGKNDIIKVSESFA